MEYGDAQCHLCNVIQLYIEEKLFLQLSAIRQELETNLSITKNTAEIWLIHLCVSCESIL